MLKINLLPAYIYERRRVKKVIFLAAVVVLLVLGVMLGWIYRLNQQYKALEQDTIAMEAEAKRVTQLKADVTAAEAKIPPIESKVNYIEGVLAYNLQLPAIYERLTRYIYSRAELNSMTVNGASCSMSGHVRTLGDFGRLMMSLYRATDVFSSVSINAAVPGWPSDVTGTVGPGANPDQSFTGIGTGIPTGLNFTVSCTLVTPAPAAPVYGQAGGGPTGFTRPMMMMPTDRD